MSKRPESLPKDAIADYNRNAWDAQVNRGNRWTVPVDSETIEKARGGNWQIVLTPQKSVPARWFPSTCFPILDGSRVLALACGGGQQAPILAAAGALVTVLDNSPGQLAQDRGVADRDGLELDTVLGDMRDLPFADETFDWIFNPCSMSFVPELQPVFDQCVRVLKPGGTFMAGFMNPLRLIFDEADLEAGKLRVRHPLPYTDETHLTESELNKLRADEEPLIFSHSLEEVIAGQLKSGLRLADFYEDCSPGELLSDFIPAYFATLATKPGARVQ